MGKVATLENRAEGAKFFETLETPPSYFAQNLTRGGFPGSISTDRCFSPVRNHLLRETLYISSEGGAELQNSLYFR